MTRKARIGLLPLYLRLYDERRPEALAQFEPFLEAVVSGFETRGVEVHRAEVCRLHGQFRKAVQAFRTSDVDMIVTLHLAYSPSLESVDALVDSGLPILMLDTTMDYDFGREVDPSRIMLNHGIHGVQDLASVLRRRGQRFHVVAGHVEKSDVLDRAAGIARSAHAARVLRGMRALRVGPSFFGMGDFAVEEAVMKRVLGVAVDQIESGKLAADVRKVKPSEIDQEMARDRKAFRVDLPEEVHRRSVRVGLALRRRLERGCYGAFSINFLAFDRGDGPVDTVPFLEASKAMARGLGYAGEGDVLTASLVGALSSTFGRATFTEIFCPDWKGGTLFLSHMGEMNPQVAARKPVLCELDSPFTPAQNPAVIACAPAPGPAVLVNLAPGPGETFGLIVAPVEVLPDTPNRKMHRTVRGWIQPSRDAAAFLESYSRLGGTHHSALVLGEHTEAICAFADFAGIESHRI